MRNVFLTRKLSLNECCFSRMILKKDPVLEVFIRGSKKKIPSSLSEIRVNGSSLCYATRVYMTSTVQMIFSGILFSLRKKNRKKSFYIIMSH